MPRQRKEYTTTDLKFAQEELARAEANMRLRGEAPGRHRAAVMSARAKVETIILSFARHQPTRTAPEGRIAPADYWIG